MHNFAVFRDVFFWNHTILTNAFFAVILILQGDGCFSTSTKHATVSQDRKKQLGTHKNDSVSKRISAYLIYAEKRNFSLVKGPFKVKKKYSKSLPREMYTYFVNAAAEYEIPSFSKFARSTGVTFETLSDYRKNKEFDRAWRDCIEIRRDYLTDCALTRRYDPSFVKFLLTLEADANDVNEEDNTLAVTVKVENS